MARDGFEAGTTFFMPRTTICRRYFLRQGTRLEYVLTVMLPTNGQAFDWDKAKPGYVWTIERKRTEMVESQLLLVQPLGGRTGEMLKSR